MTEQIVDVHGFKFFITNPRDYTQEFLVKGKFYEAKMLEYVKENYNGGNFVDIGSYIGNHSIFFSQIADKVYSFEPALQSFRTQMRNIKLNNIQNTISFQCALGNKKGALVGLKHGSENNKGITHIAEKQFANVEPDEYVLMQKLDEFDLKNIKVIKVDVEGYELEVLKGAEQTLRNNNADIFIECLSKTKLGEVMDFLDRLDYTMNKLTFNYSEGFFETVFLFKKQGVK